MFSLLEILMKPKILLFFVGAALISFLAAANPWGDSTHVMGLMKPGGGRVNHPVTFDSPINRSTAVMTLAVLPPYSGDAHVVLEGFPEVDYYLHLVKPVVDFGFSKFHTMKDDVIKDLAPGDRLTLWLVIKKGNTNSDNIVYDCCETVEFTDEPTETEEKETIEMIEAQKEGYTLAFYDTKTGGSVLNIPISLNGGDH
jgi:hypothetical protein